MVCVSLATCDIQLLVNAGRSMNIPDMAKVLNHLRRDPVVKVITSAACLF